MFARMKRLQDSLESNLTKLFSRYGLLVGRHPLPFLLVPIFLTASVSYGIFKLKVDDNIERIYTPSQAKSLEEKAKFLDFLNIGHVPFYFDLLVTRRDFGPMLTPEVIGHISHLQHLISHNLTAGGSDSSTLAEICKHNECWGTKDRLKLFSDLFFNRSITSGSVKFTYPLMTAADQKFPLMWLLANVTKDQRREIHQAYLLRLQFRVLVRSDQPEAKQLEIYSQLSSFGQQFEQHFAELNHPDFNYFVHYYGALNDAMGEVTHKVLPYLAVSILALILFTVISSASRQYATSKHWESMAGVANPFLALLTAFGLTNMSGNSGLGWNGMLSAMPFLILAIGVDDMFVLLEAWRQTDPHWPPDKRLSAVMAEAGVSITITSLTNVVSFGTGITQNTPAVRVFSIYAALALTFEYFYQISFFAAVMAYGGQREYRKICEKNAKLQHRMVIYSLESRPIAPPTPKLVSTPTRSNGPVVISKVLLLVLDCPYGRIAIVILFLLYLTVSFYGCVTIKANLSPAKMVIDKSVTQRYYQLADNTVNHECLCAFVIVEKSPDFNNLTEIRQFFHFLSALEHIHPYSNGPDNTDIWLRPYFSFLETHHNDDFYFQLQNWLSLEPYKDYQSHLRFNQNRLESFMFVIYYQQLGSYASRVEILQSWRRIAENFSELSAVVHQDYNIYSDQIISLPENVIQDAGVAILVIIVIATVMVPDPICMFWVVYFLLTVEAGVVGLLKLLVQADLDPVTMITISMSVGFSVDYMLHVSYHFHKSQSSGSREKIRQSLMAISWPVVQASISTTLGVVGLALVPAYLVRVFLLTVVTVVTLGLIHGILFLPAFLTLLTPP